MSPESPEIGQPDPPAAIGEPQSYTTADHVMTGGLEEPPVADVKVRAAARGLWMAVIGVLVVLIFLIVFILENEQDVKVSFLGTHSRLPLGVALLLAAVIGGIAVVLAGLVRILQLRTSRKGKTRRIRRRKRR